MNEHLLNRYFADQCSPDEARWVLNWLETEAGQAYLHQRLKTELEQTDWQAPPLTPAPDADRLLTAFWQRATEPPVSIGTAERRWWSPSVVRWAAVFVGALLLAAGSAWFYGHLYPEELTAQTPFGQTSRVTLPDGSRVTLNGNTRLRYGRSWQPGHLREVWLDGEAFFSVTHQQRHEPFVVHLPDRLDVRVLGTQFNVSARPVHTRIVLNSGRIELQSGPQRLAMQPGELVETDRRTRQVQRRYVDAQVYASWQTRRLVFDQTTLADIVERLHDTYGLDIRVSDPGLLQQRFSGSVPNENADLLLDGLSRLFGLTLERRNNQLLIQSIR